MKIAGNLKTNFTEIWKENCQKVFKVQSVDSENWKIFNYKYIYYSSQRHIVHVKNTCIDILSFTFLCDSYCFLDATYKEFGRSFVSPSGEY